MKLFPDYSKTDKQLLYFVSLIWGVDLLYYAKAVILRLPIINHLADLFIPSVVVVSLLVCWRSIFTRVTLKDCFFYFLLILLYLSHLILFPQNYEYLSDGFTKIFLKVIPFFFVGLLFDERKQLNTLTYISILFILLKVLYFFLFFLRSKDYEPTEEYMGLAYECLPHIILVLYSLIKDFKVYKLITLVIGLFYVLGTGNRGSLLFILIFGVLYFLLVSNHKCKIMFGVLSILTLVIINYFQYDIIKLLFNIIDGVGMNTRVLSFLMEGDIANDNGRNELIQLFSQKIQESGLFGYGIMGDRVILINHENFYPHNIIIEFIIHYGVLLGGVFLYAIIYLSLRAWNQSANSDMKASYLLLLISGVLSLFLSNSYLLNPLFFMFLGLCVNYIRRSNQVVL